MSITPCNFNFHVKIKKKKKRKAYETIEISGKTAEFNFIF